MNVDSLSSLAAVALAGSMVMERAVTIAKTFLPWVFGEAGPDPESIYRPKIETVKQQAVTGAHATVRDAVDAQAQVVPAIIPPRVKRDKTLMYWSNDWRRIRLLGLVLGMSFVTSWVLSTGGSVKYGSNQSLPWVMFALLISGGSAFWSQALGLFSAAKDFRVQQKLQTETDKTAGKTVVVYTSDPPRLQ